MSKENKDGIFRYAEGYDKFLMFFGTLGSIGDGLQIPLMMYVLSDVINDYGNPNITVSISIVDKVIDDSITSLRIILCVFIRVEFSRVPFHLFTQ